MADQLLTIPQAAARLACSKRHIYNLINRGELAAKQLPGARRPKTRIPEPAIDAALAAANPPPRHTPRRTP